MKKFLYAFFLGIDIDAPVPNPDHETVIKELKLKLESSERRNNLDCNIRWALENKIRDLENERWEIHKKHEDEIIRLKDIIQAKQVQIDKLVAANG